MPDVISTAPADVRLWVALDVHKFSIVAAVLPPAGGRPEVTRIESTEKAIRLLIRSLGGSEGLAVSYEAGPGGFALWRMLTSIGVACDVIAPSLVPVRAGVLDDPLAHEALSQMLIHLDSLDRQLATLDAQLEQVSRQDRWAWQVEKLRAFRGIATLSALGLIAEIGDFARFGHARARVVAGDHSQRILQRRSATPRAHHQDWQPPRPRAADRSRVALPPPSASPRPPDLNPPRVRGRRRIVSINATDISSVKASAPPS